VPLGYRYISEPHGGRWEIDEEEAGLVRRIFALCLSGEPTRGIARILTEERIPTPSDRHPERGHRKSLPYGVWNHPTVRAILTYQGYTGDASWGKRGRVKGMIRRPRPASAWVPFRVPPIIDTGTFEATQHALRNHQRWASRNRKHAYLLAGGTLRCGRCGRAMSGTCRARDIRYYRCGSRHSILEPMLRCSGSLRADTVEAQVWGAIVRVLEHPELIAAEIARQQASTDERRAEIRQQWALIEAALTKCERELQRWADAYAAEVINLAELKGYRADIEARRQSLMTEHAACQRQMDAIGEAAQHVEALTAYCARVRQHLQTFDGAEKRVALQALDIRVSWMPGQPFVI
jgi:hypothetical protein